MRTGEKLQATLLFVDFTKAFDSFQWGKMEQILQAYGIRFIRFNLFSLDILFAFKNITREIGIADYSK